MKKKREEHSKSYIILLVAASVLLLYYYAYYSPQAAEELRPGVKEPAVIEPSSPIPPATKPSIEEPSLIEPVPVKKIQEPETKPTKFIAGLKCYNSMITLKLGNYLNKPIKLSDLSINANGILNMNPRCDSYELKPGETTNCYNIGRIKFKGEVRVTVAYPGRYESEIVDCSQTEITAD